MILLPFLSNNNYIILNHINKINKSDRDILLVHFYQTVLPGFFFFWNDHGPKSNACVNADDASLL